MAKTEFFPNRLTSKVFRFSCLHLLVGFVLIHSSQVSNAKNVSELVCLHSSYTDEINSLELIDAGTDFFVNDNSTSGDSFTTAVGDDNNAGTSSDPFATIQVAIDQATTGDVIYVDAGSYSQDVLVNKELTIIGAGIYQTVIDHAGNPGHGNAGIHITAHDVTMQDFTLIDTDGGSVPRYGLKVGVGNQTTDNVTLENIKVQNSFRTGFDLAIPKNLTLRGVIASNNGGAGIFMTNPDGVTIEDITTTGNPWVGVSIATRDDWPGMASGVVFTGNNSFGEVTTSNGGVQLEMTVNKAITWSNDAADNRDVTIQSSELAYAISGPTTNTFGSNIYDPYIRFYSTLNQATLAATNGPDHVEPFDRYIQDATDSEGDPSTEFYVFDSAGDKMSIQAAIDAAFAQNTINISAGTFPEDLNVNKDEITVLGAGIGQTIVDHTGQSGHNNAGVKIGANQVILKDLTVTGDPNDSSPRYGLKVGTSSITTDDITLENVRVQNSYRTGFDLARPKDITLIGVEAIDNGGAGIFMTNAEGVDLTSITTSGNPWIGVSVATRDDWPGDTYDVVFSGTNSIGEVGTDNGGLQIEPVVGMPISWSDGSVSADVIIQDADFEFALSGPTTNSFTSGGNTIVYDPYTRFYKTLVQAEAAAAGDPTHIEPYDRYLQDAINSEGDPATEYYVVDNDKMSIQAAVDDAVTNDVVNVYQGTFEENVSIPKAITVLGAGNTPAGSVIQGSGGTVVSLGSGNSNTERATIQNLRVTGGATGVGASSYTSIIDVISTGNSTYGISLGSEDIVIAGSTFSNNNVGMKIPSTVSVSNLSIDDSHFDNNTAHGWYSDANSGIEPDLDDVEITNTTFNGNGIKGFYTERLSNALFENVQVDGSGTAANTYASGIDINLKWKVYSDITLRNVSVTNSGTGGASGNGVTIKGRNDGGTYGSNPASIDGLTFDDNTFQSPGIVGTDTLTGLSIGNAIDNISFLGTNTFTGTGNGFTNYIDSGSDFSLGTSEFSGDLAFFIANFSPLNIDALDTEFDGKTGYEMSIAERQTAEDKIYHEVDNSSLGLVWFVPECESAVYVNDDSQSGDVYTSAIGDDLNSGTAASPVRTISRALDLACSGSIIYVDVGNYYDSFVLDSTYSIRGANYGINPNTGSRSTESTLYPDVSDPDPYSNDAVLMIYLTDNASGTEIDGLTIDGDNPNLTSGVVNNGADVDASQGIAAYDGLSDVSITNNIIGRTAYTAVEFYNYNNSGSATTGNLIADNRFENILPDAGFGIAVLLYNNCYTDITSNVFDQVRVGVQTGNFYQADPGNSHDITGNNVNSGRTGIWHNLAYQNVSTFNIQNNTVTTVAGYVGDNQGLKVTSLQGTAGVNLSNNTVSNAVIGVSLWNNPTSSIVTLDYIELTDCEVGVQADNYDGYNSDATSSSYIIDNVDIQGAQTGILVKDNSSNSNNATVTVEITNFTSIDSDLGLAIEGADASVSFSGATPASFTGQTVYIDQISNGDDVPSTDINAFNVQFDGSDGASMTLAQQFDAEDKLNHKPDYEQLGLISFVPNNVFITTSSYVSPNSEAAVQRGVDVALDGETLNVNDGTYEGNVLVDKNIALLSHNGAANTILDGDDNGSGLGTIQLSSGRDGVTIGGTNRGFTVKGIDGPAGLEKAAVYLQGTQSNIVIEDNLIEARGDAGLMGEYNASNDGITINNNEFTGQTFTGSNPAGVGFSAQFALPNVPRQAVVFGGGSGTSNTQNITFTNNTISTISGGQSLTDNSGNAIAPTDQGNMIVTLDLVGNNVISGNTFNGYTTPGAAALRVRGSGNYTIDENLFTGGYDVAMATASNPIDASLNYWDSPTGPYNQITSPCATGKIVPDNVTFVPYYTDATLTTTSSVVGGPVYNVNSGLYYCTIQSAIDAASTGDEVQVSAGTYNESLNVHVEDLLLIGAGIDQTIVDHSGTAGYNNAGVKVGANGVTMQGFTVIDNDGGSVPRYGLKVGTSGVTTDDVTLQDIKVTQSYRTGFDLARPKNLSLIGVEAINNGGAGIFMTNAEGVDLTNITTSGNPWVGISVATRDDWAGDTYDVVFSGTNSIGEVGTDNGGLQIEPVVGMPISWSDGSVSADVIIQPADFEFALSGPTTNSFTSGGNTIVYDPYTRFYKTLTQAESAADGAPSHVEPYDRYIQDAISSAGDPVTEFYVYDNTDDKMSIQAAVDASVDGNKINVYDGDFTEQVEVAKDITIEGQGAGVTNVIGFDGMPLSFATSDDNFPIIYIHDADAVISNLTVDGDGKGVTNRRYVGIGLDNAGGLIDGVEVKAIRENPLNGNQHGVGILANSENGDSRNLEVLNSNIYDFQKNAFSLGGADLTALVEGNTVTGAGSTGVIGQNGIQLGYGATGDIIDNDVSGIDYTGSGWLAAGIMVINASGNVTVSENTVSNCMGALVAQNSSASFFNNEADQGDYGVLLYSLSGTSEVVVQNNSISNYEEAIYFYTTGGTTLASANENSLTGYANSITNYGSSTEFDVSCNWYGTSDATVVDASVSGDLTYNPYLVDGTDASGAIGFQPSGGACSGDSEGCTEPNADNYDPNAIFNDGSCEYCFEELDFSSTVAVAEDENPDAWYTDRYAPAGFESVLFDNDDRLKHSIDAADGANNRSSSFSTVFYNTQGRKYDLTTGSTKEIGIELYVPSAWESSGRRMAGIWGTGFDNADAVSTYPIIEFTSDGTPRFRGYEGDGSWIDIGLPNNFSYDTWVTLTIKLLPSGEFRYEVGDQNVTTQLHSAYGTTYLGNVILQGHNTVAGVSYDIHWDNFYNSYGTELEYDAVLSRPIDVGSGLSNQHMAVADLCDIEAGIKAHKRYLGDVIPVTGDVPGDTYQFGTGVSPMSSANMNPDPGTARWNYLVSVDLGDQTFNDLNVYLDIDFDPSDASGQTDPYVADLSQFMIDNGNGSASLYQDSQNLGFNFWQSIGSPNILPFDPYEEGVYDLTIRVETPAGVELLNAPIRVEVACDYVEASEDLEAPFIDCPDDLVVDTDPGSCSAVVSGAEPTITADDCVVNLTYTITGATTGSGAGDVNGLVFNTGVSTVTYNATDGNSNTSDPCSFTVTVEDNEAPVVTCVDQTVTLDGSGSGSVSLGAVLGTSNDNCGITDVELSQNTFDCSDIGAGADNVTITVTDNAGNTGTCNATITVVDNQLPTINCPGNQTLSTDNGCNATMIDYTGLASTSDNCSVNVSQSPSVGQSLSVGNHTVTLTATDAGGNPETCTFALTVEDDVDPVAICQDISVDLVNGSATITAGDVDGGSGDNCGITSMSVTPNSFTCADVGDNDVELTVEDAAGNTNTCTATVTVVSTVDVGICFNGNPAGYEDTFTYCENETIDVTLCDAISGVGPFEICYQLDSDPVECVTVNEFGSIFSGELAAGTYEVQITSVTDANGCSLTDPSLYSATVVVNAVTGTYTAETSCDSYEWNGNTYTTTGVFTIPSTNANNCQHVDTLDLTILESTTSSITETACDTYTAPDGAIYSSSGVYTAEILNEAGCDSTITINLTITTPGDSCNDGDPLTENDVYDSNCDCEGTPIAGTIEGTVDWNQDCGNRNGTIKFYEPGTTTLVEQYNITVDQNGEFSTPTSGVAPGNYDIFVKVEGYLQKGFGNVSISSGSNSLNVGSIVPGDLNGDNGVDILDVTVISDAFLTAAGQPGFMPLADFNCDGVIDILDVTVISDTFLKPGDEAPLD